MLNTKAAVAELVGTFALTFVGAGTLISTGNDPVPVALAHGLILAVMVSATMGVSGGQINPAVSVALAAIGRQSWQQAGLLVAAQLAGAVAAAVLLNVMLSGEFPVSKLKIGATLGELSSGRGANLGVVLGLEAGATFFLMWVVMATTVDSQGGGGLSGLAIGLTLAAAMLCIGPATGGSLNPARSFGPQLVGAMTGVRGVWSMSWAYWAAPAAGALAAAFLYRAAFRGT